jgi:hypothetical protein
MKRMRKLAVLLILALLVAMLGGCFSITKKTTGDGESTAPTQSKPTQPGESSTGDSTEPQSTETYEEGQELTAFIDGYVNTKSAIWDKVSAIAEDSEDYAQAMAIASFSFADLYIVNVYFFDIVEDMGGVFGFSGIKNAYKRINGNVVEFGYDYTYTADDDNSAYPAGSRVTCTGKLDMSTGCIMQETLDEVAGGSTMRAVIQINQLKNGSYASQIITSTDDGSTPLTTAYFVLYQGTDLWCAMGSKDAGTDFSYNSIYNKSVSSLDDMTSGFTVTMKASFVGDKLTYETSE